MSSTLQATQPSSPPASADRTRRLADLMIQFLETNVVPDGLFAPDVFCDLVLPTWRLQGEGLRDVTALRVGGHPWPGRVVTSRFDPTPTGFVLEAVESWNVDGQPWTCRELLRADVDSTGIVALSVFCTGDWDAARTAEHAAAVELLRP